MEGDIDRDNQRSTKKVKTKQDGDANDTTMEDNHGVEMQDAGPKKSYAESLLSSDGNKCFADYTHLLKEMEDYEDKFLEEEDSIEDVEGDLDPCPKIQISQEEFEEWCAPWKNALVINVLARHVSFKALEHKIHRDWAKNGAVRIIDMPNDYFLVQFKEEENYRHALYEGPWKIADHYIVIQRWRPFFTVTATKVRKIAAWIRIPGLPIELYHDRFLWRVGNKLGTMLKIDKLTSIHSRGKFAQICVEINLNKKLVSKIDIMGHVLKLEYEELHSICFSCGKYGHRQNQCAENTMKTTGTVDMEMDAGHNGENNDLHKAPTMEESVHLPSNTTMGTETGSSSSKPVAGGTLVTTDSGPKSEELYGPWMLVKHGRKSGKNLASKARTVISQGGTDMTPSQNNHVVENLHVQDKHNGGPMQKVSFLDKIRNQEGGKNPQRQRGNTSTQNLSGHKKKHVMIHHHSNMPSMPVHQEITPVKPSSSTHHHYSSPRMDQHENTKKVLQGLREISSTTYNKNSSLDLSSAFTHVASPDKATLAFAKALRNHFNDGRIQDNNVEASSKGMVADLQLDTAQDSVPNPNNNSQ
ncbi:uncharacterized protein LOC109815942 [Cajanus cajan]|uniref:uncharacterized protein LOC109815942 n=1 Tax=Cajanus cajan TaxID=3821 RepID=UPI00098DCAAA|nr:uncharacterized protein LOC109815942 [Cajanus cajan]